MHCKQNTCKLCQIRLLSIQTITPRVAYRVMIPGRSSDRPWDLICLGQDLFLDKHLPQYGKYLIGHLTTLNFMEACSL